MLLLLLASFLPLCSNQVYDYDPYGGYLIQQVTEPVDHAEGPHWKEDEQALYYVDIAGFGVHRYEPYTFKHSSITLESTVGALIPIKGMQNIFVIGYGTNISILTWPHGGHSGVYKIENKFTVDKGKLGNRFNDGKADVRGRLWIGTMGEEKPIGNIKPNQGSLYKVAKNCELRNMISPVSISNGIIWNTDNTKMYYIDSPTRKIDVFSYNICNGMIGNRQTFFDFEKNNITGEPDGMTIDTEDNLWIAAWGGGKVLQVSREGLLLRSIPIPAERVTSVAWGGKDFSILFVTTMKLGLTSEEQKKQPAAGAVFKVVGLAARGKPASSVTPCLLNLPTTN